MRVRVHFNLHRKDFSVVDPRTGRVLHNTQWITLRNVEFRVSEKGRQRVIQKKIRSVHAYAIGTLCLLEGTERKTQVTYNPYRCGAFHVRDHPDQPVWKADVATFNGGYCWINPMK
jgi:hypothetical protein